MTDYTDQWPKLIPDMVAGLIADIDAELAGGPTEARRLEIESRKAALNRIAQEYGRKDA